MWIYLFLVWVRVMTFIAITELLLYLCKASLSAQRAAEEEYNDIMDRMEAKV